jgi:hypothetical protein
LAGGGVAVKKIVTENIGKEINFSKNLAAKVFNFAERWAEITCRHELLKRYVHIYNPDLQGPFPLADVLWGADIYTDLFDEPEAVQNACSFFADVIIAFLKKYHAVAPPFSATHSIEWGMLHKGGIIIRNDAAMNVSGEMYAQFIQPYDQRIIDVFGGGIHFCGKGDHYISCIADIKGLSTFNMSEPEYNDMEIIYQNTIDKGIVIIGLPAKEVTRAVAKGRNLHGRVHAGASLAAWADKKPA